MNARASEPRMRVLTTSIAALLLTVLPMPYWLDVLRPEFLVLTVIYWSIAAPRAGGIALGFLSGLALDVFQGALLGQHALALCLVTYIAVREHPRIRSKPLFQQMLMVFGFLFLYEFVTFAIDGWSGHPLTAAARWVHVATGALVWPMVSAMLERTHSRALRV